MNLAFEIKITGLVQGIGFRPFIYKAADKYDICGFVANRGGEVIIHAEGKAEKLKDFIEYIKDSKPVGAVIHDFNILDTQLKSYSNFEIKESIANTDAFPSVQPDIAICSDCLEDMRNSQSRYVSFPFTSCAKCGPRLTIIEKIPYDRANTSMEEFKMCKKCEDEYLNPENRRYHAQTICCPDCGPGYVLFDKNKIQKEGNEFENAKTFIKQGKIVAVKGIGGFHLICDAANDEVIMKLRQRKNRIAKPFAVMVKNISIAEDYCYINEEERNLLLSRERPIVLLKQKKPARLSAHINTGLNYLGIMLPYSGIHEMLFDDEINAIVATSGNNSGLPLIINNAQAFEQLKQIADYFLIHNREIINRCDDSVVSNNQFIRRARGYAPAPMKLSISNDTQILACGADLKNTFTLVKNNIAYTSQYIGDLGSTETYEIYKDTIAQYTKLLNIQPKTVACDMHPDYLSSRYSANSGLNIVKVQHHYAHIASVIAEHGIKEEVIGVVFDGTGYGDDGTVWGGEFFIASLKGYLRYGHLRQVELPGGDFAAKEPWRMAGVYLLDSFGSEFTNQKIPAVEELKSKGWETLEKAIKAGINTVKTSSAGRLFDAVSAILGVCMVNTYEGQAAAELEAIANNKQTRFYDYEITKDEMHVVDYRRTITSVVKDLEEGRSISEIACAFHNTVAKSIIEMCIKIRKETNVNTVALSGGVFQNRLLLERAINLLKKEGFHVYINKAVPCNDGGISLGQAMVALKC